MAEETTPPIHLIYSRIPHHSPHSGYDQLGRYMGSRMRVPYRLYRRIGIGRLGRKYAGQSGMRWYDASQFYAELTAGLSMLWNQKSIYQFLYGETGYRYLRQFPGSKRHRIIATFHQPPSVLNRVMDSFEHVGRLDGVIVVARNQIEMFASLFERGQGYFVPHGVDTSFFQPLRRDTRSSVPTCLCVGDWLRDFHTLCQVVKTIGRRMPEVRFRVIASPANVGAYQERFAMLPNLEFRGGITEAALLRAYQDSDLFLLPLEDCTANNSLLEAMACGLPIVVTDIGGVRDYVNKDCAVLVPPYNAEAMAGQVMRLLGDKSERDRLAERVRKRACCFDWNVVAEQMKRVYHRVWEGCP